jgi:hypothetical protein
MGRATKPTGPKEQNPIADCCTGVAASAYLHLQAGLISRSSPTERATEQMNQPDDNPTLIALRTCGTLLRFARVDANTAANGLDGVQHTRATELADKLTDALDHTERLITVVTGDVRAELVK